MFESGYKSNKEIKLDTANNTIDFQSANDYIVFQSKGDVYSVACDGLNIIMSCCTTRDNKGEGNRKYDIVKNEVNNVYRNFVDMKSKQLGYYEKKVIHFNIVTPVYFLITSTNDYSYFTYYNIAMNA